jgi:hypothetical protein
MPWAKVRYEKATDAFSVDIVAHGIATGFAEHEAQKARAMTDKGQELGETHPEP